MSQVIRDAKSLDEAVEYLFGYGTNIRIMYNSEIQTLRAKVEMLVEALEFYANQDNYYVENDSGFIYPSVVKAQKALATYNKLSEVKHDTK